ncbi:MAG TPA: 50S ribosomal protein L11 methyltransferase [Caulobacterales bacterium]|nr:50S ribosomal protein L11 methyltransferase [Caulobacterales bacterium]
MSEAPIQPEQIRNFIAEHLLVAPVAALPEIRLHQAQPTSGLSRLRAMGASSDIPFWAFTWAGGLALARHVLTHPDLVANRRVLDFGSGSGLVAIAAAKAGAALVTAIDIDPAAIVAAELNAAANDVNIVSMLGDATNAETPDADLILAGDVFYDRDLAKRVLPFLQRCIAAGVDVLIGDPNRAPLPRRRLRLIAHYDTGDVGDAALSSSYVYALR